MVAVFIIPNKLLFYIGAVFLGIVIRTIARAIHMSVFSGMMICVIAACVYVLALDHFVGSLEEEDEDD